MYQFKPGDKVRPIDNNGLRRSEIWKQALRISQPYLYVLSVNGSVRLGIERGEEIGVEFGSEEIELYKE